MSKPKPQPAFLPPRVIVAYGRLTGSRPVYDSARDVFNFVETGLIPVREFNKRQRGLNLGAIHLGGSVVVEQSVFHVEQAV